RVVAGLPGLSDGRLPDDPGHRMAGHRPAAGGRRAVVAAAADAGAGRVAVCARRPRGAALEAAMKHWPRLHDSYIARAVIGSVLLAWGVLLGLDVVLAFADGVGDIGKGAFTANHAIAVTGLSIPWRAYNLFPTAE